jgi:Skp family chaperone for outer membrane proteins
MTNSLRFIRRPAVAFLILLAMLGTVAPAYAQDTGTLGIVVIDTQSIYREALAVKGLQSLIDKQRSAYQEELRKQEETLRAADQELARQRTVLSPEAFAQKRRDLEEQVATLQREIQSRRRALEKLFGEGMKQVQTALVVIAREIAEARKADFVIDKSAVALVRPELEITQEVLKRLDQKLPKVTLKAPQN